MKKLHSNTGSALVMMLVAMSVLFILGISLMDATYMAVRMSKLHNQENVALYLSDSGVNEAYAYLCEEVENGAQYSREIYVPGKMGLLTDEQKTLMTESAYDDAMKQYFEEGFRLYFNHNSQDSDNLIKRNIESRMTSALGNRGKDNEQIDGIECTVLDRFTATNTFRVLVKSRVQRIGINGQKDPASEQVSAVLSVGVPTLGAAQVQRGKYHVKRNALWDKALAAGKNIYVMSNVSVSGNVYAYGQYNPTGTGTMAPFGGVVVGGVNQWTASAENRSGSLSISGGNLVTGGDLETLYSSAASPSSISVNGDVYCSSLVTESDTSDTYSNPSITINGSVSAYDDLEMNALKSTINIAGSFFGFSDGADSSSKHNASSSVVINASDVKDADGSKLTISGGLQKQLSAGSAVAEGIDVAGTVYVRDQAVYSVETNPAYGSVIVLGDGRWYYTPSGAQKADTFKILASVTIETTTTTESITVSVPVGTLSGIASKNYQTGDSVSIAGNYMAYDGGQRLTGDGVPEKFKNIPEANFDYYRPLWLLERDSTGKPLTVTDKAEYAYYLSRELKTTPSSTFSFEFGNGNISIAVDKIKHILGTYINQTGSDSGDLFPAKSDLAGQQTTLFNLKIDSAYQVNWLGDPQVTAIDYSAPSYTYNDVTTGGVNTATFGYKGLASWMRSDWNRTDGTLSFKQTTPDSNNRVWYGENTAGSDTVIVVVRGPGYSNSEYSTLVSKLGGKTVVPIDLSSSGTKGIILAKDDIYVMGNVDYSGLIMTLGNIWILDNQPKSFKNENPGTVSNTVISMLFNDIAKTPGDQLGDLFQQFGTVQIEKAEIEKDALSGSNTVPSYIGASKDMVRITAWSRSNRRN